MKLLPRYTDIADDFAIENTPSSVSNPQLLLWNEPLAQQFDINMAENDKVQIFSGNQALATPAVALGYSGHQFGHFSPRLGDGRAHLLGALSDDDNQLWDIQLKGSGITHFSRGGDGRCAMGPAVREYIMSEAMHALGIKTTRCLAVVSSGEQVYRQSPQPGAIVTRFASSHIRVGSFQYLAAQGDLKGLKNLADLAIERHYSEITETGAQRYLMFLQKVINSQIELVVSWMRVGFIHGVMNTDNTLISGETIDYGPCAMMNQFDFDTCYSAIDKQGRYAFGNQPNIASWNCTRLAESLMGLIDEDDERAIELLSPIINNFSTQFNKAFTSMWEKKLGLVGQHEGDHELISELLKLLNEHKLDYTNTFNSLTESLLANAKVPKVLHAWMLQWQARTNNDSYTIMRAANPCVIPRNNLIEDILLEFTQAGCSEIYKKFKLVMDKPYLFNENSAEFNHKINDALNYNTFCGT
ncbi:YdiU family protein [Pseudoalteromonas sp. MMG010]|uniref:protein adenylyltransferase SelO n=1 Tax=Pseudoalteromonas sp. MMG010 TaxID=2822685 RepID=UPI001B3A3E19|nr:YdiU family protein [Pseudoalteromonas sp. MMG010]MBQ4834621.1 YdiU family protein [Pseudoalteromonas sp. MMG010]